MVPKGHFWDPGAAGTSRDGYPRTAVRGCSHCAGIHLPKSWRRREEKKRALLCAGTHSRRNRDFASLNLTLILSQRERHRGKNRLLYNKGSSGRFLFGNAGKPGGGKNSHFVGRALAYALLGWFAWFSSAQRRREAFLPRMGHDSTELVEVGSTRITPFRLPSEPEWMSRILGNGLCWLAGRSHRQDKAHASSGTAPAEFCVGRQRRRLAK